MPLMKLLNALYKSRLPPDPQNWHPCSTFFPRQTIDGVWTSFNADVWRRWNGERWEYYQDPEADAETEQSRWW